MTRDEILSMPAGREMDAMVAEKVMGLRWQYIDVAPFLHKWVDQSGETFDIGDLQYSNNIALAWEIVEKLTTQKSKHQLYFRITYRWWSPEREDKPACYACFDWKETGDHNPLYSATAETATLAICRAALLAVMAE